jgi:AAA domain
VLIQSSAAIQTKEWMRACFREGVVPLLQMHDSLDLSVSSSKQAEMVARLGEEVIKLEVPMKIDVTFGHSWGDARHTWEELHTETIRHIELAGEPDDWKRTPREAPKLFNDSDRLPWGEDSEITDSAADDGATNNIESAFKPPHICIHCHRDPPDGLERISSYNGAYLHPTCEEPFIQARMAEEGIGWQSAAYAQTASSPQPQGEPPAASPPPSPRGNGQGTYSATNGACKHTGYPHSKRDDIGQKTAEYVYHNLKGAPYLKVVKRRSADGKKYFPQYRWENGHWVKGKPAGPAIPYRLPELLAAPAGATVEICEGEKDSNTLATLGLITTTNPGGAGKWTPELNKWLSGFARANIYEDNDTPGHRHAVQVASALSGVIPDIRVVTFREMPEHSDVSDWLKTGKTREQLLERAEQSPRFLALETVCADHEEIKNLTWVWPGRFALGKIGLIVGLPDEGKGLTLSDIMARITRGSLWPCNEGTAPLGNVLLFTAEDDINDTIVPRLLAAGADSSGSPLSK